MWGIEDLVKCIFHEGGRQGAIRALNSNGETGSGNKINKILYKKGVSGNVVFLKCP